MNTKLTKALVAASVVGAVVLGGPIAADAAPYTPGSGLTGTSVTGLTATFAFGPGTFASDSAVTATVSGPGTATLAEFLAATSSVAAGTSTTSGALSSKLAFSEAGTDSVTFTDAAGNSVTTSVTVGSSSASSTDSISSSGSLAHTGTYISLVTAWGAVGLVALGAAVIAVRAFSRRRRQASRTL